MFANSPRMSRFLRFVVEETAEGRGERIKEYVIALEVFDKSDQYDPQADSTVRTEASKLRSRLSRYYETEGRDDPVTISIPRGTYVPLFKVERNRSSAMAPDNFPWFRLALPGAIVLLILAGVLFWPIRAVSGPAFEIDSADFLP